MEKALRVLMENGKDLGTHLGLFDFVDENKIKVKDLSHAVGLAQNMNNPEGIGAVRVRHRHADGFKKVLRDKARRNQKKILQS
jgi:hypothetical protein